MKEKETLEMDFTMRDFESVALHSATGNSVNVQHKKPFDIADVDNNEMKLEVIANLRLINRENKEVIVMFCSV